MQDDKLLKLYESAVNEEHYFLDAHQKRVAFYLSILSAIVAGVVAGLFQASEWYHLAILCVGPVLIYAVSAIGIEGTFRLYQRFLEAVTIRAKLEQELGLTKKRSVGTNATNSYWQSEAIIPLRHIESRKDYESSDAFIKEHARRGYHLWTIRLFRVFQGIAFLMFAGTLSLAIWEALVS
jgi:hypothetical protein